MTDLEWLQFKTRFPDLTKDQRTASIIRSHAVVRYVPAREILYRDGDECGFLPMVLSGELLLNKHAEEGGVLTPGPRHNARRGAFPHRRAPRAPARKAPCAPLNEGMRRE